jgi:hypothetical protein
MQIKLDLHVDDVNIIMGALGKVPYDMVFKLVNTIQQQAAPQVQAAQQEAKAKEAQLPLPFEQPVA